MHIIITRRAAAAACIAPSAVPAVLAACLAFPHHLLLGAVVACRGAVSVAAGLALQRGAR